MGCVFAKRLSNILASRLSNLCETFEKLSNIKRCFVQQSNLCKSFEKLSCSSKRSPTFPNSHFSIHQKRHNAMWCLLHSTPFMNFSFDVVCVNTVSVVDEFRPRACGTWSTFHGTNKLRFAEVFCTKCVQLCSSFFHEQNLINI